MPTGYPFRALIVACTLAIAPFAFAQSGGEATYKTKCQMCHGATGAGDTPAGKSMRVKPFTDPAVARMTDAAMIKVTKNGQGKMPAYTDKLTEAQIKDVISYIRALIKKR